MIRFRLPTAPMDYARGWGAALVRSIESGLDQVANTFDTVLARAPRGGYGTFLHTTTQTAAAANTAYSVSLGTTVEALWFGVVSGSRVTATYAGTYVFQFEAQADKISAGVGTIYFWLRLNGSDVANSAGAVAVQGATAQTAVSWNYVVTLAAADYVEFVWSATSTACRLLAVAAAAPVPALPSALVAVHQAARP